MRIETERLVLRPMRAGDFENYATYLASEHAVFLGGPFPRAAAWGQFCADHAGWSLTGLGSLMIETAGEAIGQVGINAGPLFPEPELGWMLYPGATGKGFATEAARGLAGWAKGAGLETLVSGIAPENKASRRLAERLGALRDPGAEPPAKGLEVWRHWGRRGAFSQRPKFTV